jgi:hypothetical protein
MSPNLLQKVFCVTIFLLTAIDATLLLFLDLIWILTVDFNFELQNSFGSNQTF